MANLLLERYRNGEYQQVWRDLVALGDRVRDPEHFDAAREVAAETMRRARHNVELILSRLEKLGYEFTTAPPEQMLQAMVGGQVMDMNAMLQMAMAKTQAYQQPGFQPRNAHEQAMSRLVGSLGSLLGGRPQAANRGEPPASKSPFKDKNVFAPPTAKTTVELNRVEKEIGGPLPISLRHWYQQVGAVNLMGRHERLNPPEGPDSPDPLVMDPIAEAVESIYAEDDRGTLELALAPDDLHKAHTSGGDAYSMKVPNAGADGLFLYERHNTMFTDYLRIVFAWGGFPGWEGSGKAPEREIAYLKEDLLAV